MPPVLPKCWPTGTAIFKIKDHNRIKKPLLTLNKLKAAFKND
jgi:hypothetical protein